jgi:DNA-binding PadR family transcriptional regulator
MNPTRPLRPAKTKSRSKAGSRARTDGYGYTVDPTKVSQRALSTTSYIVLGLLEREPATPYELKNRVGRGLGNFWTVQHAQLYTETARLAEDGFLTERSESEGRRRKTYSITEAGKKALAEWLADPTTGRTELRDLALLKVFFGAEPAAIAPTQLETHRAKLAEYKAIYEAIRDTGIPRGILLALEAGISHERESVRFWSALTEA